jgi:hypothetical protein
LPDGFSFPVVSLEVAGMRMSVKKALAQHVADLSAEISEAVDRVCAPLNVKAVIDAEAAAVLRMVIHEEVERFYRHGPGRQAVREAVEEKLGNPQS